MRFNIFKNIKNSDRQTISRLGEYNIDGLYTNQEYAYLFDILVCARFETCVIYLIEFVVI